MIRVRSEGSVWIIDEALGRYQRLPDREQPRERSEWGERPGPLRDFEWHDFERWELIDGPDACIDVRGESHTLSPAKTPWLAIYGPEGVAVAPRAVVER